MRHCQTVIDAQAIITQNPQRDVLYDASLAIDGGMIMAAGPTAEIETQWEASERLDLSGMLVMPGLINAHTHAAMTFLRGFADDLPLMDWLRNAVFPQEARLTAEMARLGSLLGYAEMLASGTTSCVDMYIFEDAVLDAADEAGLRCMGGEAVFGFPSAACPSYRQALAATCSLADKYKNHPRIGIAVNPHSVYTASPEILRQCRELALRHELPVHIHLAETRQETETCLKEYGKRPVAHLADRGLLDCRLIAAHLVDINMDEAALLASSGASGVHNPASNMKLASGTAPVAATLATGLPLGLGSDGPASNNQMNMFAEMRQAALLQKLATGDPASLPAGAVLDMATLGGAAVMGDPRLGSLKPGCHADCIALDLAAPNMQPLHNPISQAVYAASGHECRMTMVGGEVVYRDGKFTRFDYSALLGEVAKLRAFVQEQK